MIGRANLYNQALNAQPTPNVLQPYVYLATTTLASNRTTTGITLMFPSGVLAHMRMSWLDPFKSRRITVVGSKKMVVYDDLESHEKLKVYDKSVNAIRQTDTFGEFQFAYHYGSVVSPYIHFEEPLRLECLHFVECVLERTRPLTDGNNGVQVVRVIEAAQRSLRDGGSQVRIGGGIRTGRDQGELVWINGDADPVLDLAGTDVDRREATTAEAR